MYDGVGPYLDAPMALRLPEWNPNSVIAKIFERLVEEDGNIN